MAKINNDVTPPATPTALTKASQNLVITDADALQSAMMATQNFAEERTFWIGDPADNKVSVYFGELIGPAGSVLVEPPGAKPDPTTGEIKMSEIPAYLFNPLDPTTFEPFRQRVDTVLCSSMVAAACAKYDTLAKSQGGVAQILFRWNGTVKTRKGNQLNDVSVIHRILTRQVR